MNEVKIKVGTEVIMEQEHQGQKERNSDYSLSLSHCLYGEKLPAFVFGSAFSQMIWDTLENTLLQDCQEILLDIYRRKIAIFFCRVFITYNASLKKSKKKRLAQEKRTARFKRAAGFVKSGAGLTLTFFFLFSNQVSASDFQNNPIEPTLQEKRRLLIAKAAILTVAVLALGTLGYVLSSRAMPYFMRLAPSLKKNLISPLLDVLPSLPILPSTLDVLEHVFEFLPVPSFLNIPFSSELSTLPERISQALEFLAVVEADPVFSLKRYKKKAFHIVSLMAGHIDDLTALVVENKGEFLGNSGKIVLLNEAFQRVCYKTRALEAHCLEVQTERLLHLLAIHMSKLKK